MAYPSGKVIQTNDLLNYYLTMNMNNICRICLEKGPKLVPIFDPVKPPHFSVLLMACAQIQVTEGDGLPPYICQKCVSKLNIAFQFKTMCESSDAKLRQCFENCNNLPQTSDLSNFIDLKKDESVSYATTNNDGGGTNNVDATNNEKEVEETGREDVQQENNVIYQENEQPDTLQIEVNEQQIMVRQYPINTAQSINKNGSDMEEYKIEMSEYKPISLDNLKVEELTLSAIEDHANPLRSKNGNKSKKQHICDTCGKVFRTKPSLVHHIRIHTGERPYVCHLCDKRFINGGHLHTHMRTHTGEKNHVCVACNKAFATAQQLTKHTIAIHTSERPYGCTYCSKRFASSSNLNTHIRIHTGEKNYHCDQCGKSFSTKGQLLQHMLVHTGEKHFLCEICNKQFSQKAHLVRHMRVHRS